MTAKLNKELIDAVDGHVVVDVNARLLPFRVFVGLDGQWTKRRFIQLLEERTAAAFQLLERPFVVRNEQPFDSFIQFMERKETAYRRLPL